MAKPKLALFFGAGAERSYGLPSGGKFALEIFKMPVKKDKALFNEKRHMVDRRSIYASQWLPIGYLEKPVSSFGKSNFESLVKGSLENKRDIILDYLKDFDNKVNKHANELDSKGYNVKNSFKSITGKPFGSRLYTHDIEISSSLGNYNDIFSSEYFSSFLYILELAVGNRRFRKEIKTIVKAILELLIGSCGEALIHRLNDGVFAKNRTNIDVFDEFGTIFSLDYRRTGLAGLDYIISEEPIELTSKSSNEHIITQFGRIILEDMYAQALDYQALIDNFWRYLYSPKTDWAKFCKITIFLHTVRRYIEEIAENYKKRCEEGPGYYHDILENNFPFDINAVGTTNYNVFIETITKRKTNKNVFFLNGCVDDLYDPYLNKIVKREKKKENSGYADHIKQGDHITVPFLFTQSGIKPLTSVSMSEKYVKLYQSLSKADVIGIIGYGFNVDDGHINGMFRSLIEDEKKQIFIFHYSDKFNDKDIHQLKKEYQNKLRMESQEGINIIIIDVTRKSKDVMWYEALHDQHQKIKK